jgi:hypothetical protein
MGQLYQGMLWEENPWFSLLRQLRRQRAGV